MIKNQSIMKCPASMCPLFAAEGSPWTGDFNANCPENEMTEDYDRRKGCGFWFKGGCMGCKESVNQILEVESHGSTFQIGLKRGHKAGMKPKTFDCPKESECQWQKQSTGLCPPRLALSKGIDPKYAAF